MTKSRVPKLCERAGAVVLVAVVLPACAAPPHVEAPEADRSEAAPARHPDAVVLDPVAARPMPSSHADARGVVALRQPVGADAVAVLVRAWVDAWQRESLDSLTELLSTDAVSIDAGQGAQGGVQGQSHGHAALVDSLRQRFQAHEYGRLAGLDLVRTERIERFTFDDFDGAGPGLAAANGADRAVERPPEMQRDDLCVRVPLEVTRVAGERLFGDVLVFLLRADAGKLRIVGYGEADEK